MSSELVVPFVVRGGVEGHKFPDNHVLDATLYHGDKTDKTSKKNAIRYGRYAVNRWKLVAFRWAGLGWAGVGC